MIAAKEHETRQAVREYDAQLRQATQSLAEFKSRALRAEVCSFMSCTVLCSDICGRWSCRNHPLIPSAPPLWKRN